MATRSLESCTLQFEAPLSLFREQVAASDLLPKTYERYRLLLADALCFFLRRLAPGRLQQILTEQLHLPSAVSTAERVVALLVHLPALHKLGQVIARDHRLNVNFRRRLQRLESLAPQISTTHVLRLLGREFKNWRRTGIEVGPQPLAEGSVGVVMPFVWGEGGAPPRPGVFKLLKPGIRGKLEEDLKILSQLGEFLDEDCTRLGLPTLDYQETFNTIRDLLLHEICLDEEQQNLAEAAREYQSIHGMIIPELFPFCSSRLTAMERIFGDKISDAEPLEDPSWLHERLGRLIVRGIIAAPVLSVRASALFHADPHGGNFLITPDHQVAVLDWSLTGRLQKNERIALVQVVLGALTWDAQEMARALERLSERKADPAALMEIVRSSLSELGWTTLPGITWLTRLLDALVLRAGLRPSANLLLFRKSLLSIAGVVTDLTRVNQMTNNSLLDQTVRESFLNNLVAEWPSRFRAFLHDRSFGTHLAATDLLRLLWATPALYARWCGEAAGAALVKGW